MKSLLAVSWAMPPMLFPRAIQVSRTLHELHRRGWSSTVVTAMPSGEGFGETSAVEDQVLADHYRESYRLVPVQFRESKLKSGLALRIHRRLQKVGDADTDLDNWERRAFATAKHLLREEPFQVLVTFAQPWSDHRIGLALTRRFPKLPWVAHFSDPWIDNPYYRDMPEEQIAQWREQEAAVVTRADRLVFVTARTASTVMSKYDPALVHKAEVVPHGFEEGLRNMALSHYVESATRETSCLRIVYSGFLYPGVREPRALLEALFELRKLRDLVGRLRIEFIGYQPPSFREYAEILDLDSIVVFERQMGYLDTIAKTSRADALLLIDAPFEESVFLPSKLSDYLLVEKPIIGLTPHDSESAAVLRSFSYPVIDPNDKRAIRDLLGHILDNGVQALVGESTDGSCLRATYEIGNTTERFESALSGAQIRHLTDLIRQPGWRLPHTESPEQESDGEQVSASAGSAENQASSNKHDPLANVGHVVGNLLARMGRSATIAYPGELQPDTAEHLLGTAGVTSVVLRHDESKVGAQLSDRVGRFDGSSADWDLPSTLSDEILFLGKPADTGVRMAVAAVKHGIRRFNFAYGGILMRRSAMGLVLERATWSVAWRSRSLLHRMIKRVPLFGTLWARYFDFFHEMVAGRRIRKLLASGLSERCDAYIPVRGRIMLVTGTLGPGGAERQLTYTVRALRSAGMRDIVVLCEDLSEGANSFYLDFLKDMGVEVRRLQSQLACALRTIDDVSTSVLVSRLLRASPHLAPSIIPHFFEFLDARPALVHTWQDGVNVRAGLAASIAGVPRLVMSCRSFAPFNFDLYSPLMRPAYRELLQRSGVTMLNNSQAGAMDYSRWLGMASGQIGVVRNAIDPESFKLPELEETENVHKEAVADGSFVIGGILRFSEEKRPELWLDTAAILAEKREALRFLLVGDGPQMALMRRRVEELNLSDRVSLPGHDSDAARALRSMDLLLLTSRLEGLPNVLLEAQCLGVPVVSTAVGGVSEAMWDGVTGQAVPTSSPGVLAERILKIIDDADWRRNAALEGPKFVAERFSIARMGEETLAAYEMSTGPLSA